jgi:Mrp family chromosome partitioning ATPase
MDSSQIVMLELLGRIAEIKRIYSVIESSITGSACIAVTSGAQGEGKTTLSAGLAIAAANNNTCRVLAMDFNWHTPKLNSYFGIEWGNSIEIYENGGPIEKIIRKTVIQNLDILPAPGIDLTNEQSTNNPSQELLRRAKELYDVVIVDTAAVFPTNHRMIDPIEICKLSDGVVLVTLTTVTPRQELKRACTAIETAGAAILGVVANQWLNPIN